MAGLTEGPNPESAVGGPGWTNVVQLPLPGNNPSTGNEITAFNRRELDQILRVYGMKVADGEWRDYAIDMLRDRAVFSVFKRTAEVPLYRIEKTPKLARKQGAYSVVNATGQILKRGHELATVLKLFEHRPKLRTV